MDFDESENFEEAIEGGEEEGGAAGGDFAFSNIDEDLQNLEGALKSNKDGIVFAIDCRKNMFTPHPVTKKVPFQLALNIVSTVLRRKVIVQSKALCSILFWGTREKQNANQLDFVYELSSLELPSAGKIGQLELFSASGTPPHVFEEKIGSSPNSTSGNQALEHALWLSSIQFAANKFSHKDEQRIWIFSNQENLGEADRDKVRVRMDDLQNAGTEITLWSLSTEHEFDFDQYWSPMLKQGHDSLVSVSEEEGLHQVLDLARRREFPKRTLTSLPLILGPNVELGVKLYAIVLETKLPNPVSLEARLAQPVKISTKWLCTTQAQHLSQDQILTTARYGGLGSVPFSNEDKKRVKRFAPASLTVLGFKPLDALPLWQNVRAPYLIRPDETAVKNSTRAFVCLVSETLVQRKFIVARLIANKSAMPKLVALVPQAEEINEEDKEVKTPMGFLVIPLPFADDIREPFFPEPMESANRAQIEAAKRVIAKLSTSSDTRFDPREYENPALQKFYHGLEALALDNTDAPRWTESSNDLLRLPNEEELVFDTEFANITEEFSDSYGGAGSVETAKRKPAASKRKAKNEDDDEETGSKKKTKKQAEDGEYDDYKWKEMVENDTLGKLKNDELKIYLGHHGLPKSGTKAVMIEKITKHVLT